MSRWHLTLPVLAVGCALLVTAQTTASTAAESAPEATGIVAEALAANQKSHAQADDLAYDASSAVRITLSGSKASTKGSGVTVSGSTVTITQAGTYILSGTLTGNVVVNSKGDGKVRLVLDDASIKAKVGPALNVVAADEVVVVLPASSASTLSDGRYAKSSASDTPNAALYSRADLTIGGTGSLRVRGGTYDGIASTDGLVILGGRITVTAADDGVRGKDYVTIHGGTLTVQAGGDGVKSDNTENAARGYVAVLGGKVVVTAADGLVGETDVIIGAGTVRTTTAQSVVSKVASGTSAKGVKAGTSLVIGGGRITVTAADDALHSDGSIVVARGVLRLASSDDAVHAEKALTVTAGTIVVTRSEEGLEAATMRLAGGTIRIASSDDGINIATGTGAAQGGGGGGAAGGTGTLTITGGTIVVSANGDGLDINGSVTMSGGIVVVSGPTADFNGALDADGGFVINGGTLLAAGSAGMAVAPTTSSKQGWVSVRFAQALAAGTVVQVVDNGKVVASYTTRKPTASLVLSSSAITSGKAYGVYTGGTSAGRTVGGLATNGSSSGGRKVTTVTAGQHTGGRGPGMGMGTG